MRLATFNAENLFSRARPMNLNEWTDGQDVLEDVQRLNDLLAEETYSQETKDRLKTILDKYDFKNRNKTDRPFEIVETRGKLFTVRKGTNELEVTAKGRGDWIGWVELARDKIETAAIDNTARVVTAVNADVLCLVEVENRITLDRFNSQVVSQFGTAHAHNLLIDGNDPRGIDLGILSRLPLVSVRSHIDDTYTTKNGKQEKVFSRDCPEYEIRLADGKYLWLLANHFKSKGYGKADTSNAKRHEQATKAAEIYRLARKRSELVAVCGDFNDVPESDPLKPLLIATDLKDAMSHESYDGPPGTYKTSKEKIDYLLLSPALWTKVKAVGVERGGIYAPRAGHPFPTVTSEKNQASDHAAVWVDLEL